MRTRTIVYSIALMLLGTGTAMAYHIMLPIGPAATDNIPTQWTGDAALLLVCESQGLDDKINPQWIKYRGIGGLCYASSWHPGTKGIDPFPAPGDPKKQTPRYDSSDIYTTTSTEWSIIRPTCSPLPEVVDFTNPGIAIAPSNPAPTCPGELIGPVLGTWFARVGNNAHGCIGTWGQSFYYVEAIAYWLGTGPNAGGFPSGHVTFFVGDAGTAGSYEYDQDISQAHLTSGQNAATSAALSLLAFCS